MPLGISQNRKLWYRGSMAWIILFLPLSIWLGITYITQLNLQSVFCLSLTLIGFTLVELKQVLKDKSRMRTPLWIMVMSLGSMLLGVIWK